MKKNFVILICILYAACVIGADEISEQENQLEKEPDNIDLLEKLGCYYHDLAGNNILKGDGEIEKAAKKSEKYLVHLLELKPTHSIGMVYLGSLHTIKARTAFLPWTKLKYMNKGFALMDKAVWLDPENCHVRLIRGINSVNVPKSFHRADIALEDFGYIAEHANPDSMTTRFLLPYFYNYGLALKKSGNVDQAKNFWYKAIETDSASVYAKQAGNKLNQLAGEENPDQ